MVFFKSIVRIRNIKLEKMYFFCFIDTENPNNDWNKENIALRYFRSSNVFVFIL